MMRTRRTTEEITMTILLLLATGLLCFALFFRASKWFENI
jgi:hypothetical protein